MEQTIERRPATAAAPMRDVELAAFCQQLALVLRAGISPLEGIGMMLEESGAPEEQAVLQGIRAPLEEGRPLADALETTAVFPPYMVQMVRLGEEAGALDKVLDALQQYYEREERVRQSVRNAVTYPLVMAGMMVAVIAVLLVRVMPIFNQVFVQLGSEMTGFSRVLMNMGTAMSRYSAVFVILLVLIAAALVFCTGSAQGRALVRRLGYRVRFSRKLYEQMAACRFAAGMALTLSSGLSPERSLELVAGLNEDEMFRPRLDACRTAVDQGEDLCEALRKGGIFTGLYAQMAAIGYRTGALDQVMDRVATLYQDEIDTRINNALSVLEPTLVIVLSLIVGVILLSVMLPLMGVMSSI